MIMNRVRKADFPARYGGEELVKIFPETPVDQAVFLAEGLRADVSGYFAKSLPGVTVSGRCPAPLFLVLPALRRFRGGHSSGRQASESSPRDQLNQ